MQEPLSSQPLVAQLFVQYAADNLPVEKMQDWACQPAQKQQHMHKHE